MPRLMSVDPAALEPRFWAKVAKGGLEDCWPWIGSRVQSGYGSFRLSPSRVVGAHRVSWMLANGSEAGLLQVLHRCDNPPCVNPAHLFLGTNLDNHADKMAKGRHPNSRMTYCRRGHPFDEENTYITPRGNRMCRRCNALAQQRYEQRKKGIRHA